MNTNFKNLNNEAPELQAIEHGELFIPLAEIGSEKCELLMKSNQRDNTNMQQIICIVIDGPDDAVGELRYLHRTTPVTVYEQTNVLELRRK